MRSRQVVHYEDEKSDRQQMINLATTAQEAASSAQEAAKLTEKALEDAKGKETEAQCGARSRLQPRRDKADDQRRSRHGILFPGWRCGVQSEIRQGNG